MLQIPVLPYVSASIDVLCLLKIRINVLQWDQAARIDYCFTYVIHSQKEYIHFIFTFYFFLVGLKFSPKLMGSTG